MFLGREWIYSVSFFIQITQNLEYAMLPDGPDPISFMQKKEKKKSNLIRSWGLCLRKALCRNGVSLARGVQDTEIRLIPKGGTGASFHKWSKLLTAHSHMHNIENVATWDGSQGLGVENSSRILVHPKDRGRAQGFEDVTGKCTYMPCCQCTEACGLR